EPAPGLSGAGSRAKGGTVSAARTVDRLDRLDAVGGVRAARRRVEQRTLDAHALAAVAPGHLAVIYQERHDAAVIIATVRRSVPQQPGAGLAAALESADEPAIIHAARSEGRRGVRGL